VGVVLLCALVAVATTQLTGASDSLSYRIAFQAVAVIGVVLAGIGAWRHRRTLGIVGLLIFLGPVTQSIGDTGQSIDVLVVHSDAFPSWTDAFYLANYLSLMAAGLIIVQRRRLGRNVAALVDTATVTVGVGVLAWCFVIADAATDPDVSLLARLVGALYPICDVLVFGVMIRLLFSSAAHRGPVILLTGGMGLLFIGDAGYTLAVFAGREHTYASWIDALYLLSAFVITYSLWQDDTARLVDVQESKQQRLGPARTAALSLGALLAPVTLLIQDLDGSDSHVRATAFGGILLFALILIRMSLLVRAVESQSEQLSVLARTDSLTGLANRRTFDFELERAMREAMDPGRDNIEVISVGLLDLDHFKQFNDTFGHSRGDQLLRECAAHWTDALSRLAPNSFMARYGGEEFVVIFRGDGSRVAAEILREIMPRTPMEQTFSAGVATWDGTEPALDLLNRADKRLYAAKYAGRKTVVGERKPDFTW
jgi:diguanylate cyclase